MNNKGALGFSCSRSMKAFAVQISVISIILLLAGCFRPPEYPNEPRVGFQRLQLTDTASLVLTFDVRDGDGDIGLESEDVVEPYHAYSLITTDPNAVRVIVDNGQTFISVDDEDIVKLGDDSEPPFYQIPVERIPVFYPVFAGFGENGQRQYEAFPFLSFFRVGSATVFSETDDRPALYDCAEYEIVSFFEPVIEEVSGVDEIVDVEEDVDTVYVSRNPNHFNIFIEFQIKQGDDYVIFNPDECDPGYTSRFPVFKQSNIGRPLNGSISFAFFSVLFQNPDSPFFTETLRLKFYIYDRALNKSNEVFTPDFRLLDLRQGDLVAE